MNKLQTFCCFLLLICYLPQRFYALDVSAKAAVLYEPVTGRFLYEKNKDERLPMASTTKIVTAITAIKHGDLTDTVTVSQNAANVEGSSVWLAAGEKQTLENLLYGLLLSSGNDAAIAIAEHVGGSVDAFSALMRQTAKKAGAQNSDFQNPNGLDADGHFTTAADLAKITAYAMQNPVFAKIAATKTYTIPWEGHEWNRVLKNHNKLLTLYAGCDGVKTGFTKKSGRCLVSSATRDGIRLIAVTLNAPDDWNDHRNMLDYGFSVLTMQTFGGKAIESVPVVDGTAEWIPVRIKDTVSLPVLQTDSVDLRPSFPEALKAPVRAGETAGICTVSLNGKQIATLDIVTDKAVEKVYVPTFWDHLKNLLAVLC